MPAILIVGGERDPEVLRLQAEVDGRGGRYCVLDSTVFPQSAVFSLDPKHIVWNHARLPMPGVVYLRALASHPLMPALDEELRARPRGLVAQCEEKRAALESLLLTIEKRGVAVVNPLETNAQHSRKPFQLSLLEAKGLPVPRWVATNDPERVRQFVREVRAAVYKPLAGGASVRKVERKDLTTARLETLKSAPVLFQEYVKGAALRVYVVGRRVAAAAEIHSPEIDYRRKEEAVVSTRITPDERRAAIAAARACGMAFTGVDFVRHSKGFVVLECNPSPMFAVFERKTGLDVAGPLAQYLLALA